MAPINDSTLATWPNGSKILPQNRQIVLDGGHFITWISERLTIAEPSSLMAGHRIPIHRVRL